MKRRRPGLHTRLVFLALLSGVPASAVALFFIVQSDLSGTVRILLELLVIVPWLGLMLVVRARSRYHLRTLSNLLAALREGDFSFRVRAVSRSDPYGEVVAERGHDRGDDALPLHVWSSRTERITGSSGGRTESGPHPRRNASAGPHTRDWHGPIPARVRDS